MAIPIFQPQDNPLREHFNARIEAANAALEEKQDKLTGTQGQVVGFDTTGKPVAQSTESLVGPQGPQGTDAGFGTPTATVDANVGTPSVTVTTSGPNTAKVFNFAFKNLKGATGATGATGPAGADGKDAYEYAAEGGYAGTEAEFKALMGSGPWLPTKGGTVNGDVRVAGGFQVIGDITLSGLLKTEKDKHTITFLDDLVTFKADYPLLIANNIELIGKGGAPITVLGIATPTGNYQAANKKYVDDAIASLKQYVDDAIASIGPAAPSGAFAFSVSDDGHLICSYTGGSPPEFQISEDGHLIHSYTSGEPPEYYINENGHLCLDIEEGA